MQSPLWHPGYIIYVTLHYTTRILTWFFITTYILQNLLLFIKTFSPWTMLERSNLQRKSTFPIISMSKKQKWAHTRKSLEQGWKRVIFFHISKMMTKWMYWRKEPGYVTSRWCNIDSFDWITSLRCQKTLVAKIFK